MRAQLALVCAACVACVACSAAPASRGVEPPDANATCSAYDTNPYGVCYPKDDIGITSGSVIANFCFQSTASTVCLASYYDPEQRLGVKLIHIVVAAMWSGPSSEETDLITGSNASGANSQGVSWAAELAPDGVVFLEALDDGPVASTRATLADLEQWNAEHDAKFVTFIDPGNANLGVFFDSASLPLNIDIDARTMRILDTNVGFDTTLDVTLETLAASL